MTQNITKTKTDLISNDIYKNLEPDNMISKISLKKARKAINIYSSEYYEEEKKKNPTLKSMEIIYILNKKWKNLPKEEKEKYIKRSEEEKQKFQKEINFVRQHFFTEIENYASNAYRYYLSSILKEGFDNNQNLKKLKKKAIECWEKMSGYEKIKWNNKSKKEKINDYWEIGKNSININSFSIFCQKKIEESKKNKEHINFQICSEIWKNMSIKEKKKYEDYAEEIILERKKIRELFEIVNGIQPKKPAGAYKIFLSENAKKGFFKNVNVLKEGKKMWNELSKEEKDEYLMKAKKIKLCYIYRKMLYEKNIKKMFPSKPKSAYNIFISSIKGMKPEKNENFFSMSKRLWDNLNEEEKKEFQDLAEEEMRKYKEKMKKFENKIFDLPKKPINSFQYYIMDNYSNFYDMNNKNNNMEIVKKISNEWNNLTELQRIDYEKKAFFDKERFLKENNEFNKYGYYSKQNKEKDEIESIGRKKRDKIKIEPFK